MKLAASALRVALLLFALAAIGLAGFDGPFGPAGVHRVRAAPLDIVVSSGGNSFLAFQMSVSEACPPVLAPGDSCFATVEVFNQGDETAEISPPSAQVNG